MLDNTFAFGVAGSALLICVVNLIYTLILRRTGKTHNRIFLIILGILIINALSLIFSALFKQGIFSYSISRKGVQVSRYIYFITHTALCPMFFYYVSSVSGLRFRKKSMKSLALSAFFLITELFALINPMTDWVYVIHEDLSFERRWAEYLIYGAALFYYILSFGILFFAWDFLSEKRKDALIFFFSLVGVGVLLQLLNKNLKVEVLAEAVGFTGVMMSVENEDDRIDYSAGFYNRSALDLDVRGRLHYGRKLSLVVLRISNMAEVSKGTAPGDAGMVAKQVGSYLASLIRKYYIYAPSPGTYVLTFYDDNMKNAEGVAEEIHDRFEKPWQFGNVTALLHAVTIVADIPGRLQNISQMFYMIDSPLPRNIEKSLLKNEDLNYIIRRQAVEDAVARSLQKGFFEVYYQPTYHLDRTLYGAEALVRMKDPELGPCFPDEFIPVAEQTNKIDELDDFVLEEVCRFLETGIPEKYGMNSINVNLSIMQCIRPGFVERINGIVGRHKVKKQMIHFEITESIDSAAYDVLSEVIGRLKDDGFSFSMDDYGTGYSNVSAVFSLGLDVVKIDKSILWNAEKDELGRIILENTVRMIRQIRKKVLVEGVETEDQIRLLTGLKVDYLQGFYFSKPIPRKDFIDLLEREGRRQD